MNKVIGIVGPIASGKGVVIRILQEKGYTVLSLSDVVREKCVEWGLSMNREHLQDVGDTLRKKFGNSILAEMVASQIHKNPSKKFVIDGIRNPVEVNFLKKEFSASIVGITATPEKRFELMKQRGKSYDPTTWDKFLKAEQRDRGVGQDESGQQVEKCLKMADVIFENNGTLADFERVIASYI